MIDLDRVNQSRSILLWNIINGALSKRWIQLVPRVDHSSDYHFENVCISVACVTCYGHIYLLINLKLGNVFGIFAFVLFVIIWKFYLIIYWPSYKWHAHIAFLFHAISLYYHNKAWIMQQKQIWIHLYIFQFRFC